MYDYIGESSYCARFVEINCHLPTTILRKKMPLIVYFMAGFPLKRLLPFFFIPKRGS